MQKIELLVIGSGQCPTQDTSFFTFIMCYTWTLVTGGLNIHFIKNVKRNLKTKYLNHPMELESRRELSVTQ